MLRKLPPIRKCNIPANHKDAIMITRIGPFHGGASAILIVNDNPRRLERIVDGFESIVGVASFSHSGELHFQLVSTKHTNISRLQAKRAYRLSLPLFVISTTQDPIAYGPP